MNTHALKPGDRLRGRAQDPGHGRRVGEKGTVLRVLRSSVTGEPIYVAAMDKDSTGLEVYFLAGDIEPDV
jgi:hypothetical protein